MTFNLMKPYHVVLVPLHVLVGTIKIINRLCVYESGPAGRGLSVLFANASNVLVFLGEYEIKEHRDRHNYLFNYIVRSHDAISKTKDFS